MERALVHRSWSYENGGVPTNERLEFLGDAVLGLIVADALFRRHPDLDEDQLSRMRIAVVSRAALASVGRVLGVGDAVLLGRGEQAQGGRDKDSILEDTTEALIGAVYLAHGMDVARDVVLRVADPLLRTAGAAVDADRKTALQVLAAQRGLASPRYDTDGEGPVHDRTFTSRVQLGDDVLGTGVGRTKKAAEHAAAAAAVDVLRGGGAGAP
ncbi:MAG: ribonuclease III [Actinomycetales bacterium]